MLIFFVLQSQYIVYKSFLYVNNFVTQHVVFLWGSIWKNRLPFYLTNMRRDDLYNFGPQPEDGSYPKIERYLRGRSV
jgi:hypothetical protein